MIKLLSIDSHGLRGFFKVGWARPSASRASEVEPIVQWVNGRKARSSRR